MADAANITRRALLKSTPAALAAVSIPAVTVADELPVTKVNRIASELAHALDEYAGGSMHMEVFPAKSGKGLRSVITDFQPAVETLEERRERLLAELYDLHKQITGTHWHIKADNDFVLMRRHNY